MKKQSTQNDAIELRLTAAITVFVLLPLSFIFYQVWILTVIGFLILLFFIYSKSLQRNVRRNYGFLGDHENYIRSILLLAAFITKADKKVNWEEYEFIKRKLNNDFIPEVADRYFENYRRYIKQDINIKQVCLDIHRSTTMSTKIYLIHFLVELIAADGELRAGEEHKIYAVARHLRVPARGVKSALAMHRFKWTYHQEQKRQKKKAKRVNSQTRLNTAYAILGLNKTASEAQIKKAYRKLAKTHHPDRVIHLAPELQEKAKEKFQLIADAYALIKAKRGIS